MKLLIVEDEPSLREIMARTLRGEGYVVEQASDYASAVDKLAGYSYDCILLDIMLPGGDGLQLLKELKENGVVWVTGRKKTSTGAGAKTYRVACCPRCLSARLEATRIDSQRFRYYCWICGHTFIARLGERSEDIVEVLA